MEPTYTVRVGLESLLFFVFPLLSIPSRMFESVSDVMSRVVDSRVDALLIKSVRLDLLGEDRGLPRPLEGVGDASIGTSSVECAVCLEVVVLR